MKRGSYHSSGSSRSLRKSTSNAPGAEKEPSSSFMLVEEVSAPPPIVTVDKKANYDDEDNLDAVISPDAAAGTIEVEPATSSPPAATRPPVQREITNTTPMPVINNESANGVVLGAVSVEGGGDDRGAEKEARGTKDAAQPSSSEGPTGTAVTAASASVAASGLLEHVVGNYDHTRRISNVSAVSADTNETGEDVTAGDDLERQRQQRYSRKVGTAGGTAGVQDEESKEEEQSPQVDRMEAGRNASNAVRSAITPGTTTNVRDPSTSHHRGRRSRAAVDEEEQASSELPLVNAWQVNIDENTAGGGASIESGAVPGAPSLHGITTTTSTIVPVVEAEKSSEDDLRRWNRRLVLVIGIILILFVVIAVVAVMFSNRGNDDDVGKLTANDGVDVPTASPTTSSTSKATVPQSVIQAYQDISWTQRGETLLGNFSKIEFGKSVAMDMEGRVLAIGAWGDSNWTGRVYIYTFNDGKGEDKDPQGWELVSGDTLTGHQPGNQLGVSVDLSDDGNVLVAGENQYNKGDMTNRTGMLRVFRRQPSGSLFSGEWIQVGPDIKGLLWYEQFGWKVATSSDGKIVAGAARKHANRTGYIRAFQLQKGEDGSDENATWVPFGSILYGAVKGDQFGTSLALSGDGMTIASGADENDAAGLNAGHARVFRYNTTVNDWSQIGQTLEAMNSRDDFGFSISLSNDGNTVAVGAYEFNETMGYVHVYKYNDYFYNGGDESKPQNTWMQKGSTLYGPYSGSQYGISVKLSSDGTNLIVGANEHNFGQQDRNGRAYVYEFVDNDEFPDWVQVGPTFSGDAADDRFGWDVASARDGHTIAVTAYRSDENGDKSGSVKIFDRDSLS